MSTIYYTGKGDDGTTGILSDKRVRKDDVLIDAIGDIDELNSSIGVALADVDDETVKRQLRSIQNSLFVLGANLASTNEKKIEKAQIKPEAVSEIEAAIKEIGNKTPELKKFVLPGGSRAASDLHLARAVARRCERRVISAGKEYKVDKEAIAYLNRLSSYLFAAALYMNHSKGVAESNPTY